MTDQAGITDISQVTHGVFYHRDASGNLTSVQPLTGDTTTYGYQAGSHLLTSVTDARNVQTLTAHYDSAGDLDSLSGIDAKPASIATGSSDGFGAGQLVTAVDGSQTESIFNAQGDVIRRIQTIRDGSGAITGYRVTVTDYAYSSHDITDAIDHIFHELGPVASLAGTADDINAIESVKDYLPFVVDVAHADERYTRRPTSAFPQHEVDFNHNVADDHQADQGYPASERTLVRAEGGTAIYRLTIFGQYDNGSPKSVTNELKRYGSDSAGNDGFLGNQAQSYDKPDTEYDYDSIDHSVNSSTDHRTTTSENGLTTYYQYDRTAIPGTAATANHPAIPPQPLLAASYQISKGKVVVLSYNTYYQPGDSTPGHYPGRLESSISAAGVEDLVTDADGKVIVTRPSNVRATYFIYDARENQISSYYRSGTHWVVNETAYDGADRVRSETRKVYNAVSGDTAPTGTPISTLVTSQTTYTPLGKTETSTDEYDNVTHYQYDLKGQLIQTVFPDNTVSESVYDSMGRVVLSISRHSTTQTDPIQATRTIYDSLGRAVETQHVSGVGITVAAVSGYTGVYAITAVTGGGLQIDGTDSWKLVATFAGYTSHTRVFYNDAGQVVRSIDASGRQTGSIYDDAGQLHYVGTIATAASAETIPAGAPVFDVTAHQYLVDYTTYENNELDQSNRTTNVVTDADGHSTTTTLDRAGRPVEARLPDGTPTVTQYWTADDYDRQNLPAGSTVTETDEEGGATTIRVYDSAGRLTDVYLPAVTDKRPQDSTFNQTIRPHWSYTYDDAGNQLTQTDPNGHVTSYTYDAQDNRVGRVLPAVDDTVFTPSSESYQYDAHNRVTLHVDFDSKSTVYHYDDSAVGDGRLSEVEYFTGTNTSGTPASSTVYHYDSARRPYQLVDDGSTTTNSYDPVTDGITEVDSPQGVIHHEYDHATGKLTRTYTTLNDTRYDYDSEGRLWHVVVMKLNGVDLSSAPRTTTYGYDPAGNLLSTVDDNGTASTTGDDISQSYTYDLRNRLWTYTATVGTTPTLGQTFTHDNRNSETLVEVRGTGATAVTTTTHWVYDDDGRLISEERDNATGGLIYSDVFGYDLVGNRVIQDHTDSDASRNVTTYSLYDNRDELMRRGSSSEIDDDGNPTFIPDSGNNLYSYNGDGNTHYDNGNHYIWDVRNRLIGETDYFGNRVFTYTYDAAGNRVSKTVGTSTTTYLNDAENPSGFVKPLQETTTVNGSTTTTSTRSYVLGLGVLDQKSSATGSDVSVLIRDGRGYVRSLISSITGTSTQSLDYDAFGTVLERLPGGATVTPQTPFVSPDGYFDAETGNYEPLARYREGDRFLSMDSFEGDAGDPSGLHKYLYVNSNPILSVDPTGYFTQQDGYAAEAAIQGVYDVDHPGDAVNYGGWTKLGIRGGPAFRLKPDIFNTSTSRWAEIRPLSPSGIVKAAVQFETYSTLFAPFFYFPDVSWTPSTHFAVAGTMPIVFFNVGGIVFYSDATDAAEDLLALTTIAAVKSFMASQAGQRILQSAIDIIGERIPSLVAAGVGSDEAELGDSLGIGGLLGLMGIV